MIYVPKTVRKDNGRVSTKKQSAIPDAVLGPDKGGIIIDDKPAGRDVLKKDYQEMGRNVEAYIEKYGVEPNEIRIVWYDPITGEDRSYTSYDPSKFKRKRKKQNV